MTRDIFTNMIKVVRKELRSGNPVERKVLEHFIGAMLLDGKMDFVSEGNKYMFCDINFPLLWVVEVPDKCNFAPEFVLSCSIMGEAYRLESSMAKNFYERRK